MYELELRSFVGEDEYARVAALLPMLGVPEGPVRQVTYYLDHPIDTRVQLMARGGRVWQKLGRIHDEVRKEYEALVDRHAASALLSILGNLGHGIRIVWYRERRWVRSGELTVTLDHTVGYGRIVEVEALFSRDADRPHAMRAVEEMLARLAVSPTPRSVFDSAFERYSREWRALTQNVGDTWLDDAPCGYE